MFGMSKDYNFVPPNSYTFMKSRLTLILLYAPLMVLVIFFGIRKEAKAKHLLDMLAEHVEYHNPLNIREDYEENNKKWVAFFRAQVLHDKKTNLSASITISVDLVDWLRISKEGELGWVTVWADVRLSESLAGSQPFAFGAIKRPFPPNAPDTFTDWTECSVGAAYPGWGANLLSITSSGNTKVLTFDMKPEYALRIGAICDFHGLSFEIRSEMMEALIEKSLIPGTGIQEFTTLFLTKVMSSNPDDVSLVDWILQLRLATPQDDPDVYLIQDILFDDLVMDQWTTGRVKVLVQESDYYKVEVRGPGMFGSPWPEWDWAPKIIGPVWINAGVAYEFTTSVKPDDTEGDFGFWLYQKDALSLYKIIEKITYPSVYASPYAVDKTPPSVIDSYLDANNPATNISVRFNEEMEEMTFSNATVQVEGDSSGIHEAEFSYDSSSNKLSINPSSDFTAGERITLTVTGYVQDLYGNGLTERYQKKFYLSSSNGAPNRPYNESPGNGSSGVSRTVDLAWSCSDPDGDTVYYTVYFEKNDSTPDISIKTDMAGRSADPGTLDYNSTYYWQVKADDHNGGSTLSPVWQFTTMSSTDTVAPDTLITLIRREFSDIEFEWKGEDNITAQDSLLFSYYLEGYDSGWSNFSSLTLKRYEFLPNQDYKFYVKARDNAGNVDPTPDKYSFTINWAPSKGIQKMINEASDGETIVVPDGVYTGEGNKNIDFLRKELILKSENGPKNCVIDCEGEGRGFLFWRGETNATVLSGFTIKNCYVSSDLSLGYVGAGIAIEDSSPVIENCLIMNNTAGSGSSTDGLGGGIWILRGSPIIKGCLISGNAAEKGQGGGICCYHESSQPIIINSIMGLRTVVWVTPIYSGHAFMTWNGPRFLFG